MPKINLKSAVAIKNSGGEIISLRAPGGSWHRPDMSPAVLALLAGRKGCWFEWGDRSTLFQDEAWSVPITAPGQICKSYLDKSGNGMHMYSAVGRQYLLDAAGRGYLGGETGGFRTVAGADFNGCAAIHVFAAIRKESTQAGAGTVVELGTNFSSQKPSVLLLAPYLANGNYSFRMGMGALTATATAAGFPYGATDIVEGLADPVGDVVSAAVNGEVIATDTTATDGAFSASRVLYTFMRAATSNPFIGRGYGLIMIGTSAADPLEPEEKAVVRAYTRQKAGPRYSKFPAHHILMMGQSLAAGVAVNGTTIREQTFDNIMPAGGIHDGSPDAQGITGAPTASGFVPLTFLAQGPGESPIVACGNQITAFSGGTHRVLASCCARGSQSILSIEKGGNGYYEWGMAQIASYRAQIEAAGGTYRFGAVFFMQGETDATNEMPRATYKAHLMQLADDLIADIGPDTKLIIYQMASHMVRTTGGLTDIPLAQLDAAREHPSIFLAMPMYQLAYRDDNVHLTDVSSREAGSLFARVYDRVVPDDQDWKPVWPEALSRVGAVITIDFHVPVAPLVFDTVRVTDPGNYGFVVTDGGVEAAISSVAVSGDDQVVITLAAVPTGAVRVKYACGKPGDTTGPTAGARGCLRDSSPERGMYTDGSGNPLELFNWSVIFDEAVA